jgi:PiT family inorganic phosphate transporter
MTLLILVIVIALLFDYINGFHDAANSIAAIVSTKVLTPFRAVLWAAFFNAIVLFLCQHKILGFEFRVADTVAKIVKTEAITMTVILAGLIAAITWNLLTWYLGIPSSSSHTLMGGFAGAAIAKAGFGVLADMGKIYLTLGFIFLAPIIGMIISYFIVVLIMNICKRTVPAKAEKWFKRVQLVSSAAFSLGHGANDAQKVMGIIAAALLVYVHSLGAGADIPHWAHVQTVLKDGKEHISTVPLWVQYCCFSAIALGTLSGGWRIIKTMGSKITKITPLEGVAADTAGATTLYLTQFFGIPVSTTHTITGAIVGTGIAKRVSAVRWGVTVNLLWAWVLTIPVSGLLAALCYWILNPLIG